MPFDVVCALDPAWRGRELKNRRGVFLEVSNALGRAQYREAAVELLESIEEDSKIEIVPITS